ncbi:MAG TPA: hypothetical protein VFT55_02750 [Planctomycetota bacterium]|nr:hypothetical protein [Planctomycetota bacterium]
MKSSLQLTLFASFLFAACGGEASGTHTHADGTVHKDGEPEKPAGHEGHGPEHPLGEVTLGGIKVQVVLLGDIEPGKEADFDVRFPAGSKRPETLRAWIGLESGQGSMKKRFENEKDTTMHGHVLVPKPLPEGSLAWFEVEAASGTSKVSVPLKH